jgi:hypothetical protein
VDVTGDWRSAWTSALDELELDVVAVEAMLCDQHRDYEHAPASLWRPPTDLSALPLSLRPRADEILTRQLAAAQEISRRLTATRQQAAMVGRIETGEAVKRPAYLDCAM